MKNPAKTDIRLPRRLYHSVNFVKRNIQGFFAEYMFFCLCSRQCNFHMKPARRADGHRINILIFKHFIKIFVILFYIVFQDTVTFADFPLFIRKSSLSFPESPVRHCTPEFFSLFISKKLFTPLFSTVDFTKPSKPVYGEPE